MSFDTPNSVVAEIFDNEPKEREGFATAELRPGMGVTFDTSGEANDVSPAGVNSRTTYVVRVPPQNTSATGLNSMDTSPIDATIDANGHVYTFGFLRFQQARCRVAASSTAAVGDDVGWNSNGELSNVQTDGTTALTTFIGQVRELVSDADLDNDIATVEFY